MTDSRDLSRVKRFGFSDLIMQQIFQAGRTILVEIVDGFPPDAVFVRHYYDRERHANFVVVQSETFEPVKQGDLIPFGYITVRRLSEAELISGGANERQEGQSSTAGSEGGLRAADQEGTASEAKV